MSWSQFTDKVRNDFATSADGGCRTHGRRYPGCPLHKIEAAIVASGLADSAPDILAELYRELQQRGYGQKPRPTTAWDWDDETQQTLAECRQVIEGLMAQAARDRQAIAQRGRALAERDRVVAGQNQIIADQNDTLARKDETIHRIGVLGTQYKVRATELESVLKNPRVLDAARRAALAEKHPDRAKSIEHRETLKIEFQQISETFDGLRERLKVERQP